MDDSTHGLRLQAAGPGDVPAGWLSRFGGQPRLPPGTAWPRLEHDGTEDTPAFSGSLALMCQISLAELPDFPDRAALPADGMLSFFLLVGTMPPEEYGPASWRVLYSPGDPAGWPELTTPADSLHPVDEDEAYLDDEGDRWEEGTPVYPPVPIRFIPVAPEDESGDDSGPEEPRHQLLGTADCIQDGTHPGGRLLLTLDSCREAPAFLFWDWGKAHFFIPEAALRERDFGKAEAVIEGH